MELKIALERKCVLQAAKMKGIVKSCIISQEWW